MKLPVDGIPLLPPNVVAPERQVLRYITQTKHYAIPLDEKRGEGVYEGLYLQECHVPKPQPKFPPHFGEYTITVEANITTSGELSDASQRIGALANDLDKFWVYACGEPLSPLFMQLSFDVTPKGWRSNMEEVKDYFVQNCRQPFAIVQIDPTRCMEMPCYPLSLALQAREAYKKADPVIQALADLHYTALKAQFGEGRLFSFAKALELARKILPGADDPKREQSLALPKGSLKQSLHWLFDVANNRYNTRHVVRRDSPTPALQTRMSGQEIMDFQHDADLILRSLVCQKLQLATPNLVRRTTENNAAARTPKQPVPPVSFSPPLASQ